jgi:hypothetical protein
MIEPFRVFKHLQLRIIEQEIDKIRIVGKETDINKRLAKNLCEKGLDAKARLIGLDIVIENLRLRLECKKELASSTTLTTLIGQVRRSLRRTSWDRVIVVIYGNANRILYEELNNHLLDLGLDPLLRRKADIYIRGKIVE